MFGYTAVLVALSSLQACQTTYRATALPQPSGSSQSSPHRINEYDLKAKRLQVAGHNQCSTGLGTSCAYLWEFVDTISLVNTIDLGELSGAPQSQALGLNNIFPSQVVGFVEGPGTAPRRPIKWEKSGNTMLPTLGGPQGEAWDVDDSGRVVGWTADSSGKQRACLWVAGNPPQDLGTLGGASSQAVAMNNKGQVVGWAEDASGARHAFLWTPGGTDGVTSNPQMRDIHLSGLQIFETSTAIDINDLGHVVGEATSNEQPLQGFFWSPNGALVLGAWTSAHGINNNDNIVGYSQPASGGERSAILWNSRFERLDLNTVIDTNQFWHVSVGQGINSHGDIICWGQLVVGPEPDRARIWPIILNPKP